jgi:hypothetical protein
MQRKNQIKGWAWFLLLLLFVRLRFSSLSLSLSGHHMDEEKMGASALSSLYSSLFPLFLLLFLFL